MIWLAMDTSTDRAVLAARDRSGAIRTAAFEAGRRHGRDLIPWIRDLLRTAGLGVGELEGIAVGLGPGSYTGTRVGVTAAKTLAYATGARLVGLDSLHAIARKAPSEARSISVIADAQRGEVYVVELIRPMPGMVPIPRGETRIEGLASWLGRLESGTVVMGPALDLPRIRSAVPPEAMAAVDHPGSPAGEDLLAMADEAIATDRVENPWLLEPLYLRRSAAEDQWDARLAR